MIFAGLTYGKEYKAIGRDKDGLYLVMDNSYCCYFYSPECFEIVSDEYGILNCGVYITVSMAAGMRSKSTEGL